MWVRRWHRAANWDRFINCPLSYSPKLQKTHFGVPRAIPENGERRNNCAFQDKKNEHERPQWGPQYGTLSIRWAIQMRWLQTNAQLFFAAFELFPKGFDFAVGFFG